MSENKIKTDYDITEPSWGHTLERQWDCPEDMSDGRAKVQGCLHPYPKVGNTALLATGEVVVFDEVSPSGDPPDLYFATVREIKAG